MQSDHDMPDLASLLRLAADDELTPQQRAALEAHLEAHPEDASRIEFERRLRDATSRVMGEVRAPEGLRERIASTTERLAPQTSRQGFWRGAPARAVGLAASVLIVASVLVALMLPQSPIGPEARYQASLVRYLDREHVRCWIDADEILGKFDVRRRDALPAEASELLGRPVDLAGLVDTEIEGLEFVAGGECAVPGESPSIHLGFKTDGTMGEAGIPVSLFVQRDERQLELEEGVTYRLTSERRLARGVCTIYVWTRDGLLHFLVSSDAEACDLGREALGAPTPVGRL